MSSAASATSGRQGFLAATLQRPGWVRLYYVVAALVVWEIGARIDNDPMFICPPSQVVAALPAILSDVGVLRALWQAFVEIVVAFALSCGIGLAAGLLIGLNRFAYHLLYKLTVVLYGIPKVTIFPLILLAFGIGPGTKIAFGFAHGVFPVLLAVVAGLQDQDENLLKAAAAMGGKRRHYFRWVLLPHLAPNLFTGFRLCMAGVLLGVILAELYVSVLGIGYYTTRFSQNFEPAKLFALVGVLTAIAIFLNEILRRVELHYSRWKAATPQE